MRSILEINSNVVETMSIEDIAKFMINYAMSSDCAVLISLQGICIMADKYSTVESILTDYADILLDTCTAYTKTASHKLEIKEKNTNLNKAQQEAEKLINELEVLNFKELSTVINWIYKFLPYSEIHNLVINKEKILMQFSKNGFFPSNNLINNYNNYSKETAARYIISKYLYLLLFDSFLSLLVPITKDWIFRFNTELAKAN